MMSNLLAQTQPTTNPTVITINLVILAVGLGWLLLSASAISRRKLYQIPAVPDLPIPNPSAVLLGVIGVAIATFFAVPAVYAAVKHINVADLSTPAGKRAMILVDPLVRLAATAVMLVLLAQLHLLRGILRWTAARLAPIRRALGTYLLAIPWVVLASIVTEQIAKAAGSNPNAQHALFSLWESDASGVTLFKVVAVLSAVVAAPISEELLFRGLLQRLFQHLTRRPGVAILLTSLAFAMVHEPWQLRPAVFVLSVFLGLAYFRTGSLLVPILTHVVFNGIEMVLFTFLPH